ncbi:MAG: 50S ribosomal protein L6 [Oxalobacteraceae bacterium]|nr:MAG: 50S ribosomal protein L6 [Oxalobacteraceae bacterium]
MSRVGRKPIAVPAKVKIEVRGRHVHVEGPLGKLDAVVPPGVTIHVENSVLTIGAPEANRANRGYQGMMRAVLANMVHGVVHGYERSLEISGVGYKAELKGDTLVFALGYTHLIHLKLQNIYTHRLSMTSAGRRLRRPVRPARSRVRRQERKRNKPSAWAP